MIYSACAAGAELTGGGRRPRMRRAQLTRGAGKTLMRSGQMWVKGLNPCIMANRIETDEAHVWEGQTKNGRVASSMRAIPGQRNTT